MQGSQLQNGLLIAFLVNGGHLGHGINGESGDFKRPRHGVFQGLQGGAAIAAESKGYLSHG